MKNSKVPVTDADHLEAVVGKHFIWIMFLPEITALIKKIKIRK